MSPVTKAWAASMAPRFAWREMLTLGGEDAARAALSAGLDGEQAWSELTSEATIAKLGLAAGTLTLDDVIARSVVLAEQGDPKARGFVAMADDARAIAERLPSAYADLRAQRIFASSVWALSAAHLRHRGDLEGARFAALTALSGHAAGDSSWAKRPPTLSRSATPAECLDMVRDVVAEGWVGVRRKPGFEREVTPDLVRQLVTDLGIDLPTNGWAAFDGETVATLGDVAIVYWPPTTTEAAWSPVIREWVEIVAGEAEGLAWRLRSGAPNPRNASEARIFHAAIESRLFDAAAAAGPRVCAAYRAALRRASGGLVGAVPPSPDGWRRVLPGGEALAEYARRFGGV